MQQLIGDHVDVNSRTVVCTLEINWAMMLLYCITVQDGKTALHLAAEHGHASVVQLLIVAQADLNLQDKVQHA